ncbi:putative PQQ enzyme repeat domain protein [Candidatus Contendobacter odensis Run_B_J11]|uniref:Outer membrane protein assembly factor BamB n=2 Tax=Candidatus Contendibacter odensensis TaxID=1400860 RepID=A0A7U7GF62_9GAMM|nr:putative PQQ enzyme repeat domain protein [Candidatus Contendobacter odensis Run_B_J11]
MMMIRRVFLLSLLVLNAGCSWFGGSDNSIPPAELKSIAQPMGVRQIWETTVGAGAEKQFIRLTPALADGRIYAASHDGTVIAVDALSGQRLWQSATQLPISGGVGVSETGLVLVGTSKGQVVALRQADGQETWRTQVSSEVLASPRASGGVVVVRTIDGKFTGLDAGTGERRWIYAYTTPALSLRGSAPPLLTRDLIIAGLDTGKLLVLSLDKGLPVTEKTIAVPRGRTEIERLIDIDSEPRIFGDTLYLVAYRGSIAAIDMRNGNLVWNRELSSYAGLDVDDRQVYVSDDTDAVLALDRRNGGTLWKQPELTGRRLSAPAATGEYVVVGDFEGYLHWLSKDSGKIVGRVRATGKSIVAPPLAAGDLVFVQGQGGSLGAFRAGE